MKPLADLKPPIPKKNKHFVKINFERPSVFDDKEKLTRIFKYVIHRFPIFKFYKEILEKTLKSEKLHVKELIKTANNFVIDSGFSWFFFKKHIPLGIAHLEECMADKCAYTRFIWKKRRKYKDYGNGISFQPDNFIGKNFEFFRDLFENHIARDVRNRLGDKETIVYASIGSGQLLQTFLQLMKLKHVGYHKFILHLVDTSYGIDYTGSYSLINDLNKLFTVEDIENTKNKYILRFNALNTYFFQNPQRDSIEIYVWDSFDSYSKQCEKYPAFRCDILSIIDIPKFEETTSRLKNCLTKRGKMYYSIHHRPSLPNPKFNPALFLLTMDFNEELELFKLTTSKDNEKVFLEKYPLDMELIKNEFSIGSKNRNAFFNRIHKK